MQALFDTFFRWRRRAAEALGVSRYSWPALNGLDRQLAQMLGQRDGFFIEAGANDGYTQSNTYYFEKMRNWSGILIEPIPDLCARCRRERPRSVVVQAALVRPDHGPDEIEMNFAGLMSVSARAFGDEETRRRHVAAGLTQHGVNGTYTVKVPARTLSSVIDAHAAGREIDLLSLDVEGSELEALAGLDLARHAPRYLLVEARGRAGVIERLGDYYEPPVVLFDAGTHEDLCFRRR